jgi:cell division protein FtsZ
MDELTEITEYIQEQAGEEAEMIFGHGVDPDLGDRIRVTVIATGFQSPSEGKFIASRKEETKTVHDLERSQGWLFTPEANSGLAKEIQLKKEPETKRPTEETPAQRSMFSGPFNKVEQTPPPVNNDSDDEGEESLFADDEFDNITTNFGDQVINDDGMMELRSTKQRLQQQADERKEKMRQARKNEMTKEEFNEKWSLPAYLRRGVKMNDVPHSSESFISKYNLNDDNNILGNNKFLHDNVD